MRWMLLIVALAGCNAGLRTANARGVSGREVVAQNASSGFIGCAPSDVEIRNLETSYGLTWQARCQGRVMYCSGFGNDSHCADAID